MPGGEGSRDSPGTRKELVMGQQDSEFGFVESERTDENTVTTVIVTGDGATAHPCPGGLTADDLVD